MHKHTRVATIIWKTSTSSAYYTLMQVCIVHKYSYILYTYQTSGLDWSEINLSRQQSECECERLNQLNAYWDCSKRVWDQWTWIDLILSVNGPLVYWPFSQFPHIFIMPLINKSSPIYCTCTNPGCYCCWEGKLAWVLAYTVAICDNTQWVLTGLLPKRPVDAEFENADGVLVPNSPAPVVLAPNKLVVPAVCACCPNKPVPALEPKVPRK